MPDDDYQHTPVLLYEVLSYLGSDRVVECIDGTAGLGGYIIPLLEKNNRLRVLGVDQDQTSLDKIKTKLVRRNLDARCVLVRGNYRDIKKLARENEFEKVTGIIFDLGFSSLQLDDPERGFSFQNNGPLDMRYDQSAELSAAKVVNSYPETKLRQVIKDYGEEKFAKKIAQSIVVFRNESVIADTHTLSNIITNSLPKSIRHRAPDHLRRVFQAIRIEVNAELTNLTRVLPDAFEILAPGGKLLVISFHSLEDRIVKNYFKELARDCVCPPEFPTCICNAQAQAKILTRKPVTATEEELSLNPKSKPAKLRVAEKIKN